MADTQSSSPTPAVQTTTAAAASTAASTSIPVTYGSSTTISSLASLKAQAPQVYKAMILGIAMNICNDMKDSNDRLKQMIKQGSNSS